MDRTRRCRTAPPPLVCGLPSSSSAPNHSAGSCLPYTRVVKSLHRKPHSIPVHMENYLRVRKWRSGMTLPPSSVRAREHGGVRDAHQHLGVEHRVLPHPLPQPRNLSN